MPNNGKKSVYRTIDLDDPEIYEIGRLYVAEVLKKPLLGRADIEASKILEKNLKINPDPNPHPRHANIVDWPEDREKYRFIAVELAAEAELHLL